MISRIGFSCRRVSFEGKARLILIEGGSHRFEHLDIAIGEIEALMSGLQAVE